MEKKDSKKNSKKWGCEHGCDVSLKPCKHLEALLPQPDRGRMSKELKDEYGHYMKATETDSVDFEHKARVVEKKLLASGLEPFRVQLLMDRFVSSLTLKEIAEKYGYVNSSAVQYLIKDTLKICKSMGFHIANRLLGEYNS